MSILQRRVSAIFTIVAVCFLSAPWPAFPQAHEASQIAVGLQPNIRIEGQPAKLSTLKERMAFYNVPGVSIAFLQDHKIVWTYTEGVIDKASNTPIDQNTVFQAASISKPVFATTLMLYRQDNSLDLDANINTLLKSWQLPAHAWLGTSNVTLRRLLSHSAGTTVHGFGGYAAGEDVPSIIDVLEGAPPANSGAIIVDIEPGTKFRYSGGGTTLAQLALQDVSGEPLPEMAQRYIFGPLGMARSAFSQPLANALKANAAAPHNTKGNPVAGGAHTYATLAAAGLWTTPTDLLKLAAAMQKALKGTDQSFISQATAAEMLSKQFGRVGVGFFLSGEEDVTAFFHGGANAGFRAQLFAHTQAGDGIAIMTNGDGGNGLITEIINRIGELHNWHEPKPVTKKIITLSQAQLDAFSGNYRSEDPDVPLIKLHVAGETLIVDVGNFVVDEVFFPEAETTFFAMSGASLNFTVSANGKVTALNYGGFVDASKVDTKE